MLAKGNCNVYSFDSFDFVYAQFFLMVQEALAGCQEDIVYTRVDHLLERAVALDAELDVGTVVAHHIHLSGGQFIAIHLIHPSLDGLYNLRILETVDMIPSTTVAAVGREEAAVVRALEGHAEVVALRIERIAGMFQEVASVASHLRDEDVEASHSGMSVGREIEVAVGPERRKHLVALCIDGFSKVLHAGRSRCGEPDTPDVESSLAARHVACEVEPLPIGRDGRMGIARQRVAGQFQ